MMYLREIGTRQDPEGAAGCFDKNGFDIGSPMDELAKNVISATMKPRMVLYGSDLGSIDVILG